MALGQSLVSLFRIVHLNILKHNFRYLWKNVSKFELQLSIWKYESNQKSFQDIHWQRITERVIGLVKDS